MDKRTIFWTDLANPRIPGTYKIGVGRYVVVTQSDIKDAGNTGRNPQVDLQSRTSGSQVFHMYDIVGLRRQDDTSADSPRAKEVAGN